MIDIKNQTIKYIKRYNYINRIIKISKTKINFLNNKNKHNNYIWAMIKMAIYNKNRI